MPTPLTSQSSSSGQIEPSTVFRPVRANGMQRMMLYWERTQPVNGIHAFVLGSGANISFEHLDRELPGILAALRIGEASAKHHSAEIRFFDPPCLIELRQRTFCVPMDEALQQLFSEELNRPFAPRSCPLRFTWVEAQTPEGKPEQALSVTYRHAVAAGVSVTETCRQILNSLQIGTAASPLPLYDGNMNRDLARQGFGKWHQRLKYFVRELSELSTCHRLPWKACPERPSDVVIHPQRIPINAVKQMAGRLGVKVPDIILAAMYEGLAKVAPELFSRREQVKLAVQCPIDLHGMLNYETPVFGQLMGSVQYRQTLSKTTTFEQLVPLIGAESARHKQHRYAALQPTSMWLTYWLSQTGPRLTAQPIQRMLMPVTGGLSNIDARAILGPEHESGLISSYHRATFVGQLIPLMLFPTSLGNELRFTSSRNATFLSRQQACELVTHISDRLTTTTHASSVI